MSYENTVECQELVKKYMAGEKEVKALDNVSLKIRRGEYVSIMGPSGAGKTTLFNLIGGLDRPTSGSVFVDQVNISELDSYELAWLRVRKIGYIFQSFNLIPVLTAYENVELPMIFAEVPPDERRRKVKELLEIVGLGHRMQHKPAELSGGEQQRVAIARALANDPVIVLADEPTGNLDLNTGLKMVELLRELNRQRGVTIVTATHDLKMIDVSDRIIYLRDGKIERIETREEIVIRAHGGDL